MYSSNKVSKNKEQQWYLQYMCQRSTSVLVCSALQVYFISGRCWCGYTWAKTFPVTNTVNRWPPRLHMPCPFYLSDLISYHYPFIYYSWSIFMSSQILNPSTFASPVPILPKSSHASSGLTANVISPQRPFLTICLRSWSHLSPLLSILLPWLILFTAHITIWNYFSYVFSSLFIVYFHPGKCELYEAGIFYVYCDFSSLQQCLVHNRLLNICLNTYSKYFHFVSHNFLNCFLLY